jgi:hypothetical protein
VPKRNWRSTDQRQTENNSGMARPMPFFNRRFEAPFFNQQSKINNQQFAQSGQRMPT